MTILLDNLSGGAFKAKAQQALASGRYRHESWFDNVNPIRQLFLKSSEFGRSVAHQHVWLGEAGLRRVLTSPLDSLTLMAQFTRLRLDINDARQLTRNLLELRAQGPRRRHAEQRRSARQEGA